MAVMLGVMSAGLPVNTMASGKKNLACKAVAGVQRCAASHRKRPSNKSAPFSPNASCMAFDHAMVVC